MPMMIEWSPAYSVGSEMLDAQHRKLLVISNSLGQCAVKSGPDSDSEFHSILNDLTDYARVHFRDEETSLQRAGFPLSRDHLAEHEAFFEYLVETLSDASDGRLDKLGMQRFIARWWNHHILSTDMAYRHLLVRH